MKKLIACSALLGAVVCSPRLAHAGTKENKAIVMRSVRELWSRGNARVANVIYSSEFICHNVVGLDWHGVEGIREAVASHRIAFPDWEEHVQDIIAEGDRVVIRLTASGTQRGTFAGIPASGHKVTVREVSIYRVSDGKIREQWGMPDVNGMLTQLRKPD